jgi:hypothetical protein
MWHLRNNLFEIINNVINDIENASPVARDKLLQIYPINFLLSLEGHKNIYISLDKNNKNISFEKTPHIDFEIRSSIKEMLDLILSKKIKKEIIYGDNEKAILMINAILKSDIDIVFLIDKYFGNVPAVLAYLAKEKLFTTNQYNKKNKLQSKLRDLSIRLDRLEAVNNL